MSSGGEVRLGVIGDPVAHSLSPAFQQPALDALRIPARFARWHTTAEELPARIASLREPGVLGANVTVPHKVAVMALLDDIAPPARRAGAVNTVVNRDGRLIGDNTDIHGFTASVREGRVDPYSQSAVVLGAGGAARAVVLALHDLGVREIAIANRHVARAEGLAADLPEAPVRVLGSEARLLREALRSAALLVNATSLGWKVGETPLPVDLLAVLPPGALVVDLTYRDTLLLETARAHGLATMDGLAMLVHQGARSLELWTGREAPIAIMKVAAEQARAAAT